MKKLQIPLLKQADEIDQTPFHRADVVNWNTFPYQPDVRFRIARTSDLILLHYFVSEQSVRARYTRPNDPVYQDSCVEFFVQPGSSGPYMNFEFNAIGTCLSQVGLSRHSREFLDPEQISRIQTRSSLGQDPLEESSEPAAWDLFVAIPLELLFGEEKPDLHGKLIRGNFYKCGDQLRVPHYVSWNPIETGQPDFHRPEFFGILRF